MEKTIPFVALLLTVVFAEAESDLKPDAKVRIVGGRAAKIDEVPYIVSLRRNFDNQHICGGNIINSRFMLTAAHCLYHNNFVMSPLVLCVVAGVNRLEEPSRNCINVKEIYIHPKYHNDILDYDIALLELRKPLALNNRSISPVKLFTKNNTYKDCRISGWGYTKTVLFNSTKNESDSLSETLMIADVELVSRSECIGMYSILITERVICARGKGTDSCSGDSGGPLVCDNVLTGLVSYGIGCADPRFAGVYTNVTEFTPWINHTVGEPVYGSSNKNYAVFCFYVLVVLLFSIHKVFALFCLR